MTVRSDQLPLGVAQAVYVFAFLPAYEMLKTADIDPDLKAEYYRLVRKVHRQFKAKMTQLDEQLSQSPNPNLPPVVFLADVGRRPARFTT